MFFDDDTGANCLVHCKNYCPGTKFYIPKIVLEQNNAITSAAKNYPRAKIGKVGQNFAATLNFIPPDKNNVPAEKKLS